MIILQSMSEIYFASKRGYEHLGVAFPDVNGGVVDPEKQKIIYEGAAHYGNRKNIGKWCASVHLKSWSILDIGEDERKRLMKERGDLEDVLLGSYDSPREHHQIMADILQKLWPEEKYRDRRIEVRIS